MKPPARPVAKQSNSRWVWFAFFLLVVAPLYFIAVVVCIRSGLLRFNGGTLSSDQLKAILTFLAAALAATAAVLGSILTRSHNNRTLALQAEIEAETNERLNLDTVIRCLGIICQDGKYSPKAATAAGLATLVQLGHPIIAMRALSSAFPDDAVDRTTAVWLIGQVLTTSVTKGTPADLEVAKEEAATFLRISVPKLTEPNTEGDFVWPGPITARWPSELPRNASQNVIIALGELLLSRPEEWWCSETSTPTWIVFTLDEAVKGGINRSVKLHAAATGAAMLEVITDDQISGAEDRRSRSEVVERMASVLDGMRPATMLPAFCARIHAWGQGQTRPDIEPPQDAPAH